MQKKETDLIEKRDFKSVTLLFFFISFIGWGFETLVCFVQSGTFCDRGFLTLPFCPIYGIPVCVIFLIFGRPTDGLFYRILKQKKSKRTGQGRDIQKFWSVLLYFFSAALIATVAEFVVGIILDSVGISLWSYRGVPFCFMDVVCLPVSLVWGALITVFSQFILPPVERFLIRLPRGLKTFLSIGLWLALIIDFVGNWAYYLQNGSHYDIEDKVRGWFSKGETK